MSRNPVWVRDELILLLDLYMRIGRRPVKADHPDVIELSEVLNHVAIHTLDIRQTNFRNPNGISMKLGNLLRLDPTYVGQGLARGNRLEVAVWEDFAGDPDRLRRTAEAIRAIVRSQEVTDWSLAEPEDDDEFSEGCVLTRVHRLRERSREAVARKKRLVLASEGRLVCAACDFDFEQAYGQLGCGFAECHHNVPLADLADVRVTRSADLAILCANCHRVIHRKRPMLSVGELRLLVMKQDST